MNRGVRLPEIANFKVAKHSKGNAQGVKLERPNVRVIQKNRFESVATIDELVLRLFGPPQVPLADDRREGSGMKG